MKRILILGSSVVAASVAREIRQQKSDWEITIFSLDGNFPYSRDQFSSILRGNKIVSDALCEGEDFYKKNNIDVITDKDLNRINFKRSRLFTDEKEQIDFDELIITDLPGIKYPNIKGTNKSGVYGMKSLSDVNQIKEMLPITQSIVVSSDGVFGLNFALSLLNEKRDVLLILSDQNFITKAFTEEQAAKICAQLEQTGLRIVLNNKIAEVLGDKDAEDAR